MRVPAVSIGIPTFNRASLLQSVIQNLRTQTFGDFELVISDNASTDPRVRAVCESAAVEDPRIRCYYHDRNQGAAANFWFVYGQARAPLFMWASDDDVWPQDFIERGVTALRLHPSVSAWFCQVTSINAAGEVIRTLPSFARFSSTTRKPADLVRFLWEPEVEGKANLIHALFRRETLAELIDEWKTWPESWGADMAFVYGYLCRHDIVIDDHISLLKRAHTMERAQSLSDPRSFIYPWPKARGYFRSYVAAARGTRYRALTLATLCARWFYDVGYHSLILGRRAPLLPPARG